MAMGKSFHNSKPKGNLLVRIAAVLLCLTLFSTYLVAGLFARYTTSGESSDDARVAKFSITGEGELAKGITAEVAPGETKEVPLKIKNDSEVAVEYTVTVTSVTKNLPLSFRIGKTGTEPVNGTSFTDQLLPGSDADNFSLYIDWNRNDDNPDQYMGMVDYITVTVTATQID